MRVVKMALFAALAAGACEDRTPTALTGLPMAQPTLGEKGVILGQVVGRTFAGPPGDTSLFNDAPIADARVDAYRFQFDSMPPDSGGPGDSLPPQPILIATTLTNAQGRFHLATLEAGFYLLAATPSPDSRFAPGSTALFVDGRGTNRVPIVLFAFPDTVPPDTLPPPPDSVVASGRVALARLFTR